MSGGTVIWFEASAWAKTSASMTGIVVDGENGVVVGDRTGARHREHQERFRWGDRIRKGAVIVRGREARHRFGDGEPADPGRRAGRERPRSRLRQTRPTSTVVPPLSGSATNPGPLRVKTA